MKIRKLTPEDTPRALALLRQAFPNSDYEARLVERLHKNNRVMHEWVCIHINKVVAYIAFTNAYDNGSVCGLHLAPLAVKPEFQGQGFGSELLRFGLRQEAIRESTVFVLGEGRFYRKFGFAPCAQPACPFDRNNGHFFSLRNRTSHPFTVGYEAEFERYRKKR